MRRILLFIGLVALAAACSTRSPERIAADARTPTVLEVDNRGNLDMTIYVVELSGSRTRLGSVVAHTVDWLTIPARLMRVGIVPLQFQADPVGAAAQPVSQTINVVKGDTVVMVLPVR